MKKTNRTSLVVPEEVIESKIYFIRERKIMFDHDLPRLYEVETRRLKEQVKRNLDRFPEDFMFKLSKDEYRSLRSQFATLKKQVVILRL